MAQIKHFEANASDLMKIRSRKKNWLRLKTEKKNIEVVMICKAHHVDLTTYPTCTGY
jgi:hypothetical protein